MSLWNAVTDISFPPCRQQIELKCEDQIPVQRQPGCYPDRSTPRVRRVLFQPLICLRTITCLKLPVKNTVRSGSQQHKQAQQSWPFLQGQTTNSFVEIWRVLTTSNKNWTPHVWSRHVICHWGDTFSRSKFKLPHYPESSNSSQKEQKALSSFCPPLPDILRKKKKSPLLFLFTSGARENDPVSSHTQTLTHRLQTFTHTTHTCCPWAAGRGWGGARSAEAAVSPMGHFVAYMWGIQRAVGLLCWVDAWIPIHTARTHSHSYTHTRDLRAWWTASIKAVQPGRAAWTQPTVNNIQWLQTAHLVSRWASTSFYKMHSCNYIYNIHKNTKYSSINNTRKDLMICSLYSVVSLFDEPHWS